MGQVIQVVGSLLILAAFVEAQRGRLSADSRAYLVLLVRSWRSETR